MRKSKELLKSFIQKYFETFAYFYSHLGYKVFVIVGFSLLIGVLDGLGLSMFLPLLQMVQDSSNVNPEGLGKLRFLVDGIENMGIPLNLISVLLFMVFFFFAKGGIQYFAGIYKVNVQQWFITKLRIKAIRGLNKLSYKYFVTSDAGRIQNTLTNEISRVANAAKSYFMAIQNGILIVIYMVFAFSIDSQFAVLVTIGGIITNFLYKNLYTKTKNLSRRLTFDSHFLQNLIIQNVANFKYLKATGSLKLYSKKLETSIKDIESSNRKIGKLDALLTAGREPILISVVVAVIFVQTTFFDSALGPILISLVFFYRALTYLMQLQINWNKFLAFSGSFETVNSFEVEMRRNREPKGEADLDKETLKELELKDLTFIYGQVKVLDEMTLKISSNKTTAFVGESGSGKTTLVNVVAGLLQVNEGEFFINGRDSRKLLIESYQKKIGYITQDPVIFSDSIYNNVTLWANKNKQTTRKFWEAVENSAILNFIKDLPEQENTLLGNNGVNLSGGQKQRISIARELFKDIEVLILDEATSALDSETERAIQESIDALKGNYTILIVAHRISTIKNADKIVVMSKGKIIKTGSFLNLIEESPYFKKLVELQEV